MKDPAFPDRPDHPDFWRLSETILYMDGAAESGQSYDEIMDKHMDAESLIYMADQRVRRAMMSQASASEIVMALYLDAFALGYLTAVGKENR